jgi:hypothetical protein
MNQTLRLAVEKLGQLDPDITTQLDSQELLRRISLSLIATNNERIEAALDAMTLCFQQGIFSLPAVDLLATLDHATPEISIKVLKASVYSL